MRFTKKDSRRSLMMQIKLSKKNGLPYWEQFMRWLDCPADSGKCNLWNYIEFLQSMHYIWWGTRNVRFDSFEDFIENFR